LIQIGHYMQCISAVINKSIKLKTYTINIGKVMLDMKSGKKTLPAPPCQDCSGACCTQKGSIEISIMPDEKDRYQLDENGNIRMEDGHCVYLQSDYQCSIYDNRPEICRQFNCIVVTTAPVGFSWKTQNDTRSK